MAKFTSAMRAVRDAKKQNSTNLQNAVNTEKMVSLTIKVPISYRQHWQIESKKRGVSVTQLIVSYLGEELGKPD